MRRTLILLAVVLLGGLEACRCRPRPSPCEGAGAPSAPPAPPAPVATRDLPRQTIDLGGGVTFEMVLIPAGEFDMGSPETEEGRGEDETLHRVRITKPYWLATTEVTQAAWEKVTGTNPSKRKGPTLPVTDVSWEDCQAFVKRLDEKVPGGGFRLPTEAEWEYACRAGTTGRWSFGEDEAAMGRYANVADRTARDSWGKAVAPGLYEAWGLRFVETDDGEAVTTPVGRYLPNGCGLFDMHGNVSEWCQDEYFDYPSGLVTDPVGEWVPRLHVFRGGSWRNTARGVRSAVRLRNIVLYRGDTLGLRLARTVTAEAPPPQVPGGAPPARTPPSDVPPPDRPRPPAPPAKDGDVPSWAKVAPEQVEAARKAGVPVAFENSIGMRFVLIPPGTFPMGSPETEDSRDPTETRHEVTLTRPYYLQTTEVTNRQYRRFRADHRTPEQEPGQPLDGEEQPAGCVSWNAATAFVAWLGAREPGRGYRLPTEAEWERACRAGTTTAFWWGPAIPAELQAALGVWRSEGYRRATLPVGTLPANPWGLHEVHGNVREWVSDWYDDRDYPPGPATDPTGPPAGAAFNASHAVRGGGFGDTANMLRSAFRIGLQGDDEERAYIGLRVAVSVAAK